MKMKALAAAGCLSVTSGLSLAIDVEPYVGFGLTGDPVAGVAEYTYTDGSEETLVAGSGFGVLIGSEVYRKDDISFDVRVGAQIMTMSGTTTEGEDTNDTIYYFPVLANVGYDLSRRWSVAAGASILLFPTYWSHYDGDNGYIRGNTSFGFNAELRYTAIPFRLDRGYEAFYVLRYQHNNVEYDEIEDYDGETYDASGIDDEEIRSIQLGLKLRF